VDPTEPFVPLLQLALDLAAPVEGWAASLTGRNIEIVEDDLGRDCINRADARHLFAERREAEARKREVVERNERQAIERDRQWLAQLWGGVPADHLPPGVAPAAVMLQADKDSRPRRLTPLQEALSNTEGLIYHSLAPTPDEDASFNDSN
jgi:hypothetical protein